MSEKRNRRIARLEAQRAQDEPIEIVVMYVDAITGVEEEAWRVVSQPSQPFDYLATINAVWPAEHYGHDDQTDTAK